MQAQGLNLLQIGLLGSALEITKFFMEVPTGLWSDRFGAARFLKLGNILWCLAWILFMHPQGFYGYLAAHLLIAAAESCISGAFQSVVSIESKKQKLEFSNVYRRMTALTLLSLALGSALGGVIYQKFPSWVFYLVLVCAVALFFISASVRTTLFAHSHVEIPSVGKLLRGILQNSRYFYIFLSTFFFSIVIDAVQRYWQPILSSKGIQPTLMGLLVSASTLMAFAMSARGKWFDRILDGAPISRFLISVELLVAGFIYALLFNSGLTSLVAVFAIMSIEPLRNMVVTIAFEKNAKEGQLATILSINSWLGALGESLSGVIGGFLAQKLGATTACVALASVLVVSAIVGSFLKERAYVSRGT